MVRTRRAATEEAEVAAHAFRQKQTLECASEVPARSRSPTRNPLPLPPPVSSSWRVHSVERTSGRAHRVIFAPDNFSTSDIHLDCILIDLLVPDPDPDAITSTPSASQGYERGSTGTLASSRTAQSPAHLEPHPIPTNLENAGRRPAPSDTT